MLLMERLDAPVTELPRVFTQSYWGERHGDGLYRPVALVAVGTERVAFGLNPIPYHLVSLALHAMCSVLVWLILRRLVSEPAAFTVALLFAAHPVHAESVITAYGQADLLAATFGLLAVHRFLAARGMLGTLLLLFLAMCCKESAIVVPALMVLVRGLLPDRRSAAVADWFQRRDWLLLIPAATYLMLRWLALDSLFVPPESTVAYGYRLPGRIKLIVVAIAHCIRLSILPWGQAVYYGHLRESLIGMPVSEAETLVIALMACVVYARLFGRTASLLAMGWFAIAVLPVAQLVPIGVVVAERTLYLAIVGPVVLVGMALAALYARGPRWLGIGATAAVLAIYMGLSIRVAYRWRNEEALWRSTVEDHPRSPRANATLGMVLLEGISPASPDPSSRPRIDEARLYLNAALRLNPSLAQAFHGLGLVAMMDRDYLDAKRLLWRAYEIEPTESLEQSLHQCEELARQAGVI